jgi:uncharacterized cupin superfamily protein
VIVSAGDGRVGAGDRRGVRCENPGSMERFNVITGELPVQQDRSGYAWRGRYAVARALGLRDLGASVYELPAGESTFPYHYHHGVEEWLYVISGAPTLRDAAGERVLEPGDVVGFPSGPEGAHTVRGPGRVLMLSGVPAAAAASVSVYPDSGKLGVRPRGGGPDRLDFRRGDAVDYWDDE